MIVVVVFELQFSHCTERRILVTRTGKTERSGRSGSIAVAGWRLVGDWIVEAFVGSCASGSRFIILGCQILPPRRKGIKNERLRIEHENKEGEKR